MKSQNTKAIILGHKNFGERDKLIFLYSEEFGKLKAIAKGARKINSRFSGNLSTLNQVSLSLYFGPKNILITEIENKKNNIHLYKDLEIIKNALLISEVTNKLTYENQKITGLMQLLKETCKHLSFQSEKSCLISFSFIIKLLDLTGFIPNFTELNTKIEQKYLKFFDYIKKEKIENITNIKLSGDEEKSIYNLLQRLIEYQASTKIKSLSI